MARIAVDLDDNLYSFTNLARKVMTKIGFDTYDKQMIHAAYSAWTEWRSLSDLLGVDKMMEVIDICHGNDLILAQQPYEGAVETCQALSRAGHELLYISNRATETEDATHQWLSMYGFINNNTELMCLIGDKTPHLVDCQYMIDDRPKNLVTFVYDYDWTNKYGSGGARRRGFGLTTEANRALTDVPGIYMAPTWHGLNYYFERKGLLTEQVGV